jgi:hypothetical protein
MEPKLHADDAPPVLLPEIVIPSANAAHFSPEYLLQIGPFA